MKYKSISVRNLYIVAASLTIAYIVLAILTVVLGDLILKLISSDSFKELHPEAMIRGRNKLMMFPLPLLWLPYLIYTFGCMELGFSIKRCRKTFKAAPILWLLAYIAEHAVARVILNHSKMIFMSEEWMIQKAEYIWFFLGILNVASLVIVCTSAALGMDEVRHVDHMK
ncbi:MAG: hypothetical protein IJ779_09045 [Ruminococcus sp.]|nr:hypothetical protein [Ruminococcus sp.]